MFDCTTDLAWLVTKLNFWNASILKDLDKSLYVCGACLCNVHTLYVFQSCLYPICLIHGMRLIISNDNKGDLDD